MDQDSILTFDIGAPPANFCPATWDEVFKAIKERLIAKFSVATILFQAGSVPPSDTSKIWVKDGKDFWYFNPDIGDWAPILPSAVTGQVPVGALCFWAGSIAKAPANFSINGAEWMFCDGRAISRSVYTTYMAEVGENWGAGDGSTTVNIPDLKDIMIACASQDDSGIAKTTIADPANLALLQGRGYTQHKHHRNNADAGISAPDGIASGSSYSSVENAISSVGDTFDDVKIIPPFKAAPCMVRVK